MSTGKIVVICFVALVCSFLVMVGGCSSLISHAMDDGFKVMEHNTPHLGLVRISGAIEESEKVVNQLVEMRKNENIVGIIVRVNSPGGAVASSQEINRAIEQLVKDSIPVVASYGDVAASGGLYSTLSATKIFANEGTLTGSIGVIFQFPDSKEMLDKIGLKFNTVKSGEYKDIGNPFRHSTSKDLTYLKSLIDNTYEQFFNEILKHRAIEKSVLTGIADGRVITGKTAYDVGLIDSVGTLQEATKWLSQKCGLDDGVYIEEIKPKKRLIEQIMDEPIAAFKNSFLQSNNQLLYLMQ